MKFFSLIPNDLNIDFVGLRKVSYILSVLIILVGVASIVYRGGLRYGIDFAGGAIVQVRFEKSLSAETIKASLAEAADPGFTVQSFGAPGDNTWLIRIPSSDSHSSDNIRVAVTEAFKTHLPDSNPTLERLEVVGPKVGADLRGKALEAMFYSILLMAIYISGRFEQKWLVGIALTVVLCGGLYTLSKLGLSLGWLVLAAMITTIVLCIWLRLTFALGAIISLLHDVLITVGLLSLIGMEFDLTTIAALLTLVGFSLNDTIIVFDRIRENIRNNTRDKTHFGLAEIINHSINQTLSRTILTSGTTMLVLVALLVYGGDMIHDFALVMFMGVFIGTASSIFVASPVLLAFGTSPELPDDTAKPKAVVYDDGAQV